MKVVVTLTREYEMDESRVLGEPGFVPPAEDVSVADKRRWLVDSFWELCGFERDEDHVDGKYVWLVDEFADTEFAWPKEP